MVQKVVPGGPATLVAVSLSAPYAFEVMDGARSISAPATRHELAGLPDGRTLRLVALNVFLDLAVRVAGGDDHRFEYSPPALGKLDIRAARGDCKILVGKRDLGYGPLDPMPAVAGEHQISLSCPDGQNPTRQATVPQGVTVRVAFTK